MKIEFDKAEMQKVLNAVDEFAGKLSRHKIKNAFNRAGFSTRNALKNDIPNIFKVANDYTKNSVLYEQLKFSEDGTAVGGAIAFKKKVSGGGVGAGIYLMPEEWGGPRGQKGLENELIKRGLIKSGTYAIPTKSAPNNLKTKNGMVAFANALSTATVTRIGYRKSKIVSRAFKNVDIFSINKPWGRLKPGIYQRNNKGVIPLFIYVDKTSYKQVFHFYKRAMQYFSNFFIEKMKDEANR